MEGVAVQGGRSYTVACRAAVGHLVRGRKGTAKNLCDKDFAELSGQLSGAICRKALVLSGNALKLFRKFFAAVRAIFLFLGSFLALDLGRHRDALLVARPSTPLCRETPVARPLSQIIAATPPLLSIKWSIAIQSQALEGGYRRKSCL